MNTSVRLATSTIFPEVHDENAIGHVVRHAQVVRDEKISHAHLALQVLEEIEHSCLRRKVERRHGLIQDQELWVDGDGSRNAHSLPLAAAELVRKPCRVGCVQTHPLQQLDHVLRR